MEKVFELNFMTWSEPKSYKNKFVVLTYTFVKTKYLSLFQIRKSESQSNLLHLK